MSDFIEQLSPLHTVEREEITKAFREVFALSAGKRVLFWMLEQAAIYQDAFAGEATNSTNYTLGRQSAGRRLIEMLDAVDPRFYPALLIAIADLKTIDLAAAESLAKQQEGEEYDVEA
ncbi:hypothetical protein [Rhizobium lentis]|uniref:hypothetical protein n=1 Tax=Rhizobium lentis TaxID=1138194 RepID=UPI001C8331D9|nr:hypothetical protein [Rhizobium lentis]MBX5020416.1 hypothetical protein [Rhizobium lentis]